MTRVRAPELRGRGWLNTGGRALSHRGPPRARSCCWTSGPSAASTACTCSTSCARWRRSTPTCWSIIGVHSPKFEHERDPAALAAAVERYGVAHPVLDDPELGMWDQYAAKAWPTLCGDRSRGLRGRVDGRRGARRGAGPADRRADRDARRPRARCTAATARTCRRRRPAHAAALPGQGARRCPSGTLLVADSAHHSLVELARRRRERAAPDRLGRARAGSTAARRGRVRRAARASACCRPRSPRRSATTWSSPTPSTTCCAASTWPPARSARWPAPASQWRSTVDDRRARRAVGRPLLAVGRGLVRRPGHRRDGRHPPAVVVRPGPKRTAGVYAGTTVEALRDGPLDQVWMAQPSGLSVSADGATLWIADSESSALRYVARRRACTPRSGRACSTSATWTGRPRRRLLQHPLGVCALPDGSVLIADTYNGAVRRYDPATGEVSTVATGLAEPSDIVRRRRRRACWWSSRPRTGWPGCAGDAAAAASPRPAAPHRAAADRARRRAR